MIYSSYCPVPKIDMLECSPALTSEKARCETDSCLLSHGCNRDHYGWTEKPLGVTRRILGGTWDKDLFQRLEPIVKTQSATNPHLGQEFTSAKSRGAAVCLSSAAVCNVLPTRAFANMEPTSLTLYAAAQDERAFWNSP